MTLDQCEVLFRAISNAQSLPEACLHLTRLFEYYKLVTIEIGRGNNTYWRARVAGPEPWPTIADMGYPPQHVAKCNRLNDAGSPCFYGATREVTALCEIAVDAGQYVQLAGFRVFDETPIRIAVIGELFHVYKTGYLRLVGTDPDGAINRAINSYDRPHAESLLFIDAFLASLLADASARDKDYMLSRAIAAMIYRDEKVDGIMFPSVRDNLGMNIALRAGSFDEKLHAVCCFHARIKRIRPFGFIGYEVLREVERLDDDEMPVWLDATSQSIRRHFNLSKAEFVAAGGDLSAWGQEA